MEGLSMMVIEIEKLGRKYDFCPDVFLGATTNWVKCLVSVDKTYVVEIINNYVKMGIPFKMSVYKADPKYFLFVIHMADVKLINL
jgi:hypothetical protein